MADGEESQKLHYEVRGYVPTWKTVAESDEVKKDIVASAVIAEINNASKTQPMVKKMDNFWSPAEAMGKSIIQGDVTLDNADEKTKAMGADQNK